MSQRDTGTDKLLLDVADGVARVTFNNPAKRNALSVEMRSALPKVLESLQADPEVRVVILAGAGQEAFISGADISEFGERRTSPESRAQYDRGAADAGRAWLALEKPVLAQIRGFCMGGGLLTALSADVRICSDDAQFGIPAARLGLGYGFGGVDALARVVGAAWAAEMLFSARRLSAREALAAGLVSRVVPGERLEGEVTELAHAIRDNAPLTVAACKAALREWQREPAKRDLAAVAARVEACFRSDDYKEGQRAFAEKRRPRFTGS
jgi:enoyl-CoA hydratase/carnithine racemase